MFHQPKVDASLKNKMQMRQEQWKLTHNTFFQLAIQSENLS